MKNANELKLRARLLPPIFFSQLTGAAKLGERRQERLAEPCVPMLKASILRWGETLTVPPKECGSSERK